VTGRASGAPSLRRPQVRSSVGADLDQPLGLRIESLAGGDARPGLAPSPTICVRASLRSA